jgi:hypothetical protein
MTVCNVYLNPTELERHVILQCEVHFGQYVLHVAFRSHSTTEWL